MCIPSEYPRNVLTFDFFGQGIYAAHRLIQKEWNSNMVHMFLQYSNPGISKTCRRGLEALLSSQQTLKTYITSHFKLHPNACSHRRQDFRLSRINYWGKISCTLPPCRSWILCSLEKLLSFTNGCSLQWHHNVLTLQCLFGLTIEDYL